MVGGSLFERLTAKTTGEILTEDDSIRQHLIRMLTTRQGAVQALPDYGLPDLNDLHYSRSELILQSCAAVQQCINRYEPRLTEVTVSPVKLDESTFTMGFAINAMKVSHDGTLTPWQWTMTINGDKVSGVS